jgi:hypothetical protein
MNITQSPNIKPFRDYDEHEVYNGFFSANVASLNKGTFVSIVPGASGNLNVIQGANRPPTPLLGAGPAYGQGPARVTSYRSEVKWKVQATPSGTVPLGVALYDVRETNAFGESYLSRPKYERIEQEVVVSGEALPILARGLIALKGFSGTAAPGSGINFCVAGAGVVGTYTKGTSYGRFLSAADADGYALFKVEL